MNQETLSQPLKQNPLRAAYSDKLVWQSSPYEGIKYALLSPVANGRTALLSLEKGAQLPLHRHLGWEQIYVLSGALEINQLCYQASDYVFIEANLFHSVIAKQESRYLVISETEGVEFYQD